MNCFILNKGQFDILLINEICCLLREHIGYHVYCEYVSEYLKSELSLNKIVNILQEDEESSEILSVRYSWDSNIVQVVTTNGVLYNFMCDETWTDLDCQISVNEAVEKIPYEVIILPVDIAPALVQYSDKVQRICYNERFDYVVASFAFDGLDVATNIIKMCPILVYEITDNDKALLEQVRQTWDAGNPDRLLPDTIYFDNRQSYYNFRKSNK